MHLFHRETIQFEYYIDEKHDKIVAQIKAKVHYTHCKFKSIRSCQRVQGCPKTDTLCLYALISLNIDRFSNLFHCPNQQNICNNNGTKDPTTFQVCRYTTL